MPTNVFGNSSNNSENKSDTSLLVQKLYSRTKYFESNIEEDKHLRNQFEIKKLPCPQGNSHVVCMSYDDKIFKDDLDFYDVKLDNIKFVTANYAPAVDSHLFQKYMLILL